ncbi:MAG: glycosyltransferase, partial [Eubacterium sp.]
SYGNCCLVSDICENSEVVEDKAVLFKKGNIEDLQSKLQYLLDNPETVKKYQQNASEFIINKYSWDDIVDITLKLYNGNKR